jgi:hypothetical protein
VTIAALPPFADAATILLPDRAASSSPHAVREATADHWLGRPGPKFTS